MMDSTRFDDDPYERLDREFEFRVRCGGCGSEYTNLDRQCDCGSATESYSGADASRWNDHARRMGY